MPDEKSDYVLCVLVALFGNSSQRVPKVKVFCIRLQASVIENICYYYHFLKYIPVRHLLTPLVHI